MPHENFCSFGSTGDLASRYVLQRLARSSQNESTIISFVSVDEIGLVMIFVIFLLIIQTSSITLRRYPMYNSISKKEIMVCSKMS